VSVGAVGDAFEIRLGSPVLRVFVAAVVALGLWAVLGAGAAEASYTYFDGVNGPQSITIPFGVSEVTLDVIGGAGGFDASTNGCVRGNGSEIRATVPVTQGQQLDLSVGSDGGFGSGADGGPGGQGGGGAGGSVSSAGTIYAGGGGGGGATSVSTAGQLIVLAGGGGGCGGFAQGPAGGGQGDGGNDSANGDDGGSAKGGSGATSGGVGSGGLSSNAADAAGADGVSRQGGAGAGNSSQNAGGGGGGGGFFGGGGGGGSRSGEGIAGGGGGGADFIASGLSNASTAHTGQGGSVRVTFNPAGMTLGQVFVPSVGCKLQNTYLQTAVSGGSYTAPTAGVITSWWYEDGSIATPGLSFKVAHPAGGSQWTVSSSDAAGAQPLGQINSYPARAPVEAGDIIGMGAGAESFCLGTGDTSDVVSSATGDQQPGQTATYSSQSRRSVPVGAQFESDTDRDHFGDLTQDGCPGAFGTVKGCPLADLAVTQATQTAFAPLGGTITYTLVATNNGPDPVGDVMLSDAIPGGADVVSESSTSGGCTVGASLQCSLGTLASGASATVALVVRAGRAGTTSNTATIGSASLTTAAANAGAGDRHPANNSATVTTQVFDQAAPGVMPFGGLKLAAQTLTVDKHGKLQIPLSCPAASVGNCVGTDTLQTAGKVTFKVTAATKKKAKILTLGKTRFAIPAGTTKKITIKLSHNALKLLKKKHTLKAKQKVVSHDSRNKPVTTTAAVKLKLAKKKKH
jgi:uncharacterized repeat protein (TIGR01451 family)